MGSCSPRRRVFLSAAVGLLLLALALRYPFARWVFSRENREGDANALSRRGGEFLEAWRKVDSLPPAPMCSIPFAIERGAALPEVASIVIENTSHRVIRNFWFYREDTPNFYSSATVVESVTRGLASDTEKVIALWSLFPKYYYNFYPADDSGLLNDPPTVFAVFGTAQCNNSVKVLETLCQMAGCETRTLGISYSEGERAIAHMVMEAVGDSGWVYLDPDGHSVYRRKNGECASAQDLLSDPSLVLTARHAYYDNQLLVKAFDSGEVQFHDQHPDKFYMATRQTDPAKYPAFRHIMRYDLLPGTEVRLFPRRKGKFYSRLREPGEPPLYCNGLATWEYRPENFENVPEGILLDNVSVQVQGGTLVVTPRRTAEKAALIVPVVSPYVMVGGRIAGSLESPTRMKVFSLPFVKGGVAHKKGWRFLGDAEDEFDIRFDQEFHEHPLFGYAVKFEIPKTGAALRAVRIETDLQCTPKALPHLTSGKNAFILYAQEQVCLRDTRVTPDSAMALFENGLRFGFSFRSSSTHDASMQESGRQ